MKSGRRYRSLLSHGSRTGLLMRTTVIVSSLILALTLLGGFISPQVLAATGDVTKFSLPSGSAPSAITAGPDGSLWFTEIGGGKIGRVTPSGQITEFTIPTTLGDSHGITAGPDGNIWFTKSLQAKIARMTPSGDVTEFDLPAANSYPAGIVDGPDGNLWFAEHRNPGHIGRITPTGEITEFPTSAIGDGPWGIAAGPDGNLWFTDTGSNHIGRITTAGEVTEFPVPGSFLQEITAGPDGNLWFTDYSNKIGRITPTGQITRYQIPTANSTPYGIAVGSDGNIWFTEGIGQIGRITPDGVITEFPVTNGSGYLLDLATGPDGNLWFTEYLGDKIGRFEVGGTPPPTTTTTTTLPTPPVSQCPKAYFIGVRGSGQNEVDVYEGLGREMWELKDEIKAQLPGLGYDHVNYRAIGVLENGLLDLLDYAITDYKSSELDGEPRLQDKIHELHNKCSRVPIVLGGYSQGAHVVGDVYQSLSPKTKNYIAAVALFGDPRFNKNQNAPVNQGDYELMNGIFSTQLVFKGIPKEYRKPRAFTSSDDLQKVQSYCTVGDPICNYSKPNIAFCKYSAYECPHILYPEKPWIAQAGRWIVRRIQEWKPPKA